jgi:predicted O-methyltransferase YrrM
MVDDVVPEPEWSTTIPRHRLWRSRHRNQNGTHRLTDLARAFRENEKVSAVIASSFRALQRAGISVTPNHFYWPIPDIAELERRPWAAPSALPGVDLRLPQQLEFLENVSTRYAGELHFSNVPNLETEYHYNNGYFESVDAEIAYCMVRHHKPARIIEVGGGMSSRLLATALQLNRDQYDIPGELITIDPFPERLGNGWRDLRRLIAKPVQEVDLELFLTLEAGDILFLDSSHVVSIGSDVVREYLEILPRLNRGVIVHAHDIFLPDEYPRDSVLKLLSFWSEQYLMQAFLAFNSAFEVLWGSSAMQAYHPDALEKAFPHWADSHLRMPKGMRTQVPTRDGRRVWPSSFWLRRAH